MPAKIDWFYHRKGWIGCKKAQGFLEASAIAVGSQSDARREQKGSAEALALARAASKVVIARGKKTVTFDMQRAPPDDATLLSHLLGPTGNLRAPTVRKGATLLVGFGDEAYRETLSR